VSLGEWEVTVPTTAFRWLTVNGKEGFFKQVHMPFPYEDRDYLATLGASEKVIRIIRDWHSAVIIFHLDRLRPRCRHQPQWRGILLYSGFGPDLSQCASMLPFLVQMQGALVRVIDRLLALHL
jgi:hypothetical protein